MSYPTFTDQQVAAIVASIPVEIQKKMRKKYFDHRNLAAGRGIHTMPMNQWQAIWWDSGKWELRGKTKDKPFQMCRRDDKGDYVMGNVRIDTMKSNRNDHPAAMLMQWQNPEFRAKQMTATIESNKRRWQDPEFRLRMAENPTNSKPIQGTHKKTGEIRIWKSRVDAARELNGSPQSIGSAATGKTKSSAGYTWKYLDLD